MIFKRQKKKLKLIYFSSWRKKKGVLFFMIKQLKKIVLD